VDAAAAKLSAIQTEVQEKATSTTCVLHAAAAAVAAVPDLLPSSPVRVLLIHWPLTMLLLLLLLVLRHCAGMEEPDPVCSGHDLP
jgi:hypothetical protein